MKAQFTAVRGGTERKLLDRTEEWQNTRQAALQLTRGGS